jgi:hypothetical protein
MSGSSDQKQTKQENGTSDPWAPQAPYLLQGFQAAGNALGQAQTSPKPTDFVAGMTPDQLATFGKMADFGNNNTLPGQQGATGTSLTNAGASGATDALARLTGFAPTGTTQSTIDAATRYANNPAIDGMVSGAMRNANQEAQDVTLPGIEQNAALTGNTNSSRTGVAQGIVERGLAQQAGDISAGLRGQAYTQGLDLAQSQNQADTQARLAALTGAGGLGTSLIGGGQTAINDALGNQAGLFSLATAGGAGQQQADQLGLEDQLKKYQFGTNSPFDALNNYWNIVGNKSYGSQTQGTSTSDTQSTPSAWQVIGGLMSAGGSFMKSDRRVKTDIRVVGRLDNGLPVYAFKYADVPGCPTMIGLMAQDVELANPDAVRVINGVMHVDYARAVEA